MIRAGYDRSFDELGPAPAPGNSSLVLGCADIEVDGDTVRLPAGTGFDPGGIGKGLAADLVTAETTAAPIEGDQIGRSGLTALSTSPFVSLKATDGQFEQSGQELFAIGGLRPSGIVTPTARIPRQEP